MQQVLRVSVLVDTADGLAHGVDPIGKRQKWMQILEKSRSDFDRV